MPSPPGGWLLQQPHWHRSSPAGQILYVLAGQPLDLGDRQVWWTQLVLIDDEA